MFDYTQAAIKKVSDDFKSLGFYISLATQLLMIAYFCYAIYSGVGNILANILLATLSAAYFAFFIVTRNMSGKGEKKLKKITKRVLKYSKFAIKSLTLGGLVYGAVIASGNITVVDIVLVGLSLIGWIVQILFEAVVLCVESEVEMISLAIKMDVETIKKPMTVARDAIKKITGKQTEQPEPEKSGKRAKLDRLKNLFKAERDADKKARWEAAHSVNIKEAEIKTEVPEEKVTEDKKAENTVNK